MKKTAFLKKLSAIILSVVMLLSVLGGTISVSATDAVTDTEATKTDILLNNTSGRVYSVPFDLTQGQEYTPDYTTLQYGELVDMNGYWSRYGTDVALNGSASDTEDPSLALLTDGDSDEVVALRAASDGIIESTQKYLLETHRAAIAYDLGDYYDIDSLRLQLDFKEDGTSFILRNFSVYAGRKLDGSIFNNRIAVGGTNSAKTGEITVDAEANAVQYVVIVFDHMTTYYDNIVNRYGYKINLKQINLYGEESENLLLNNTTGKLYNINLKNALKHDPYVAYTPDYSTIVYDNFSTPTYGVYTKPESEWVKGDAATLLPLLTTAGNTTIVKISDDTMAGETSLNNRLAILYDLGDYYDLSNFNLGVDGSSTFIVRNFSVYAGKTADATIFNNLVARGSNNSTSVTKIDLDLNGADSVRYIVIAFDHVSNTVGINQWGMDAFLTSVEVYGQEVTDVLSGNKTAKLYYTTLATPLNNGDTFTGGTYENLTASSMAGSNGFGVKIPDTNDYNSNGNTTEYLWAESAYGIPNITVADQLALLTTSGNTTPIRIDSLNGGTKPNERRVGILYDLGARYNLDELVLTQAFVDDRELYNFSVYAGNTVDATIFNNCIGRGGDPTKTDMLVELDSKDSARYVLIMLDNMSQNGTANIYAYYAYFTRVHLFGENANLVAGNSGALYKTTFTDDPYTQKQNFVKKTYTTLEACAASGDFVPYAQDVNDVDGDGNVVEYLSYSALGLTQDDVLTNLTTPGNTVKVRLDNTTGGTPSLSSRVGLLYDLGDSYNLDTLVLGQDISENIYIYNFSVYAGNSLDATIFENEIGNGGGTDKEMTVALDDTVSARYVIIMIDHSTQSYNNFINIYGYKPTLTSVNFYGEKAEEPVETVYGDMTADETVNVLDYISLAKAVAGDLEIDSAIADLNGDGVVDGKDLIVIKKIILGIEVTPPTNEVVADPDLNDQGTDGIEAF